MLIVLPLVASIPGGAAAFSARATLGLCGNGLVDSGEECDDGGICIGGSNAGTACHGDVECIGNGVCEAGAKEGTSCLDDSSCPGGLCVRCRPFGGDGCAANCTVEMDVPVSLVPGQVQSGQIVGGTSGAVVRGQIIVLPVPLQGSLVVTAGKDRDGLVPIAVRVDTTNYARVPISNLACGCLRGVAGMTCGGTLFEADGITPSTDCTPQFTAGASACAGKNPCAPVHGYGNAASGTIGCAGLDGVDVSYSQDCNATHGQPPAPALLEISGSGPPGSARLLNTAAIGVVIGPCAGTAAAYGPDGQFCTPDDPLSSQGIPSTLPLTTGTVSGVVRNANDSAGLSIGPFSMTGTQFDCNNLASGNASGNVVGAFPSCDQPTAGDVVLVSSFSMMDFVSPTATVPVPTPTPLPPLIRGDHRQPSIARKSCQVEWRVTNPNNPLDAYGLPSNKQTCEDGDLSCDLAASDPGVCEFEVQVCLNNADPNLPECKLQGISQVSIVSPKPNRVRNPTLQQLLADDVASLNNGLTHLLDPGSPERGYVFAPPLTARQRSMCSQPFPINVLLGGLRKQSLVLKVASKDAGPNGWVDRSSLKLICRAHRLP